MATRLSKLLTPALLLGSASLLSYGLFLNKPENEMIEVTVRPVLVQAAEVHKQSVRIPIRAQGTVVAHTVTSIVSEVGGRILAVSPSFHTGGYIEQGELLVRIDDRNYQANLLRAKAAVAQAQSNLAQEKGRAEVAFNEWQKLPQNSQRSEDATNLYLRKPQLALAKAQLLSSEADLQKAQDDLTRTVIRAPYSALIKDKRSELGQYVSPGTAIATVFAIDYAEVRLAIPQSKLDYLDLPGVEGYDLASAPLVDLYTDRDGDIQLWEAKLHRTEGVYDERSRVLFTVARIEDPYALLSNERKPIRIGTFVTANIRGKEFQDLVVLPRHILRAGGNLWVIDEQHKLRNRQVRTLRTDGEDIYISSGLREGDLVCLTAVGSAVAGTTVEITEITSTLKALDGDPQPSPGAAAMTGNSL